MKTQTLKFSTENKVDFMIELRKKANEYFEQNNLSKYANSEMVIKTIVMTTLYIAPYILMVTGVVYSTPLILVCWILMGLGKAGVGMVLMHDANHGSYSKNTRINNLLSNSLLILGGLPATWQNQHNTLHHGYTNIDGYDGDINPAPLLRFSPHRPLRKIHRYQYVYAWILYGLMTISWITAKDFKQLVYYRKMGILESGKKSYTRLMIELVISKILYYAILLVIPLLILPTPWYLTLLFFFTMHFIAGLVLSTVFQTAHVMPDSAYPLPDKDGNIDHSWTVHQLLTTSDYAPNSKVLSWLTGGLNFQAVHHLFPNVCHVHYRNLAPIVKETTGKHDVPYHVQPSFLKAIRNHAKMLKLLGQEAA